MEIENLFFDGINWESIEDSNIADNINLVLVFGTSEEFEKKIHYDYLKQRYPSADIVGCSSSGNIINSQISTHSMVASAISFDSSNAIIKSIEANETDDTIKISSDLAKQFDKKGLKHIFILSDGLAFSGDDIVASFNKELDVPKTGGMAGDGDKFKSTFVIANSPAKQNTIVAIGFYGDKLHIGSGWQGGWTEFGTPRVVTKAEGNVLYELDDEPVVDYYKRYLSEYSNDLQTVTLRFPLGMKKNNSDKLTIRTATRVNEENGSMIMAGNIKEGSIVQLMKPDINELIKGAGIAASQAKVSQSNKVSLGIVVSCAGRQAVMTQLIDEEIEEVSEQLGDNTEILGFYSYGEIASSNNQNECELHNQTMTVTVIYEDI